MKKALVSLLAFAISAPALALALDHDQLYDCAAGLYHLRNGGANDLPMQYLRFPGRRVNADGEWAMTPNGAYFVPYENTSTALWVENLGENALHGPMLVRPPYCKDLPNSSECNGDPKRIWSTDGRSPADGANPRGMAYYEQAIVECISDVDQEMGCGGYGVPACNDSQRNDRASKDQACRNMGHDPNIQTNRKNQDPNYKSQCLDYIKSRLKEQTVAQMHEEINRENSAHSMYLTGWARDRIRDQLRSCRRLGVLTDAQVTQIVALPPAAPSGGSSGTGSGRSGHVR